MFRSAASRTSPTPARTGAALAVAAAVGGGAVLAALLARSGSPPLIAAVEVASGRAATQLDRIAAWLPLGYAFGAGMVAAANPCGFALLPTYLGLYLGDADAGGAGLGTGARLRRAVAVGAALTASFVALFGVAALALGVAARAVVGALPWLGLLVGVALLLAGGLLLAGVSPSSGAGARRAGQLGGAAHAAGFRGYLAYGLAYGLASLSCTLPIFLAVTGTALATGGFGAMAAQFLLYALGMGSVLTTLALAAALVKSAPVAGMRRAGRYMEPASALLLLLAGAYIVYYWLTLGGLLA